MGSRSVTGTLTEKSTGSLVAWCSRHSITTIPSDTPGITGITCKALNSLATGNIMIQRYKTLNVAWGDRVAHAANISQGSTVNMSNRNWDGQCGFNGLKGVSGVTIYSHDNFGTAATCKNAQVTIVINFTDPKITWSGATLSLSRSGNSVTATKGGSATHNNRNTITYYLYEGNTNLGAFSGNTKTISNVSAATHTYKVMASGGTVSAQGGSASVTVPAAAITWSNATLTLTQNGTDVTATMGGTATHNYGTAVTYYLYEDSTQIGTFSNNTLTFTPSLGAHTYKTVASGGGISADGASASITVVPPYKTLKIYNGSEWTECIVYRYDGNSFIEVEPYYYDGTNWSECSHT